MAYGLLSTGFAPKTFEVIRQEMDDELRATFGSSIDLSDESVLGSMVAIQAEREALLWELAESIYGFQDPDSATGPQLDDLCALTGTVRRAAAPSTVTLTLTGTATTVVTTGSRAANDLDDEFITQADATITLVSLWASTTAYSVGDRRRNDGSVFEVTVAGTSAGSGGPSTTSVVEIDLEAIEDGTVTWRYLGEGNGVVDVLAAASVTGPLVAVAGTINEIVTPVSGWDNVTNLLDATVGRDIETDEDLRVRRELELAGAGSTTADAIRANLLQVDGVTIATVFVNNTDATDADGVPPHAVEALVLGGDEQEILETLWDSVAAGIATHGTTTGTVTDDSGTDQTVKFSRPEDFDIYVEITLIKDPSTYPDDGDDQVKTAIATWGNARPIGWNAHDSAVSAQAFTVDGVLDVTSAFVDFEEPANAALYSVTNRQRLVYDTGRIVVNSSDGSP